MKKLSKQKPPAKGQQNRLPIPAGAEGLKFMLGRMNLKIVEGVRDPLVIATAREVAAAALEIAKQLDRLTDRNRDLVQLEGLHAWLRKRFTFVNDPVGTELLQTPSRMLRMLKMPEEILRAIWGPIWDAMAPPDRKETQKGVAPVAKMTGDADEATVIALSMAGALGFGNLAVMLGAQKGMERFHTCWGRVFVDSSGVDLDILHEKFGERHPLIERTREVPVDFHMK